MQFPILILLIGFIICVLTAKTPKGLEKQSQVLQSAGRMLSDSYHFPPPNLYYSLKKNFFPLYLAALGLSCGMSTLNCDLWDLAPRPGIEFGSPALGVQSFTHWTTREAPVILDNILQKHSALIYVLRKLLIDSLKPIINTAGKSPPKFLLL